MVEMFVADNEAFDVALFQHSVDAFPLIALVHILCVPARVQKEFVMTAVKSFHIYESAASGGIIQIPGNNLLVGLRASCLFHLTDKHLCVIPAQLRNTSYPNTLALADIILAAGKGF